MGKTRTRQANCVFCFKPTPIPVGNPPFGTALVCAHCRRPLVSRTTAAGTPLSIPADELRRTTGYSGRCLIHPCCPWCGAINYAIVAPAAGRATPWSAQKTRQQADAYALTVTCTECRKEFQVEWDQLPLPRECAMCRRPVRQRQRSELDARVCADCGRKIGRVRLLRRKDAPLGPGLRAVLLVGFSATPSAAHVRALHASDPKLRDAPLGTLMLSGGVPTSHVESAMIALKAAATLGRDADPGKVSYQPFHRLLLVKVWK